MRITLVTLFVLFLASCSPPFFKKNIEILSYENYKNSLPSKLTNSFQLKGKVSLFINKKGQTGKILWEFNDNKHTIHILNPFNTKIAEVILLELEREVALNFSNNENEESEELISKIFGDKDNIFLLKKFIINPPQQLIKGNDIVIKYKNWSIFYYGQKVIKNQLLPNLVEFKKGNISLKFFISDWNS